MGSEIRMRCCFILFPYTSSITSFVVLERYLLRSKPNLKRSNWPLLDWKRIRLLFSPLFAFCSHIPSFTWLTCIHSVFPLYIPLDNILHNVVDTNGHGFDRISPTSYVYLGQVFCETLWFNTYQSRWKPLIFGGEIWTFHLGPKNPEELYEWRQARELWVWT